MMQFQKSLFTPEVNGARFIEVLDSKKFKKSTLTTLSHDLVDLGAYKAPDSDIRLVTT
jgi:hypothetical protein